MRREGESQTCSQPTWSIGNIHYRGNCRAHRLHALLKCFQRCHSSVQYKCTWVCERERESVFECVKEHICLNLPSDRNDMNEYIYLAFILFWLSIFDYSPPTLYFLLIWNLDDQINSYLILSLSRSFHRSNRWVGIGNEERKGDKVTRVWYLPGNTCQKVPPAWPVDLLFTWRKKKGTTVLHTHVCAYVFTDKTLERLSTLTLRCSPTRGREDV